jgi:hypothetical protein
LRDFLNRCEDGLNISEPQELEDRRELKEVLEITEMDAVPPGVSGRLRFRVGLGGVIQEEAEFPPVELLAVLSFIAALSSWRSLASSNRALIRSS